MPFIVLSHRRGNAWGFLGSKSKAIGGQVKNEGLIFAENLVKYRHLVFGFSFPLY